MDMKTGITNSIIKGREEATLKRVERVEMRWGAKLATAICGGEGATGLEKGKKQTFTLESPHRADESP